MPLQPSTAQLCKIQLSTLKNVHSSGVGAVTLKGVKFYFRVQELPYSHLAFLADAAA